MPGYDCQETKRTTEVENETRMLEGAAMDLNTRALSLRNQLEKVLRPDGPIDGPTSATMQKAGVLEVSSPLAITLNSLRALTEQTTSILRDVQDRLEL